MTTATWDSFGSELRAARETQHRSLRDTCKEAGCSHSTLHRLEQGQVAGRQNIIRALDNLYGAGGYFTDLYGRLMYPRWRLGRDQAMADGQARRTWQHNYPPEHSGDVWIVIKPTKGQEHCRHDLALNWGPWERTVVLPAVEPKGAVLLTGKSREPTSVPLRVAVAPPAHLLFGKDDEQSDLADASSIHSGWRETRMDATGEPAASLIKLLRNAADGPGVSSSDRSKLLAAVAALSAVDQQQFRRLIERAAAAQDHSIEHQRRLGGDR